MAFLASPKGRNRIGVAPSSRYSRLRASRVRAGPESCVDRTIRTSYPDTGESGEAYDLEHLVRDTEGSVAGQGPSMREAIVTSGSM